MTCKEKLAELRSDLDEGALEQLRRTYCPYELGIDYPPENVCRDSSCKNCWENDIPEKKLQGQRANLPLIESDGVPKEILDEVFASLDVPTIKDSGSTTEFETGAHRDAREGKGRCDLLPLEVVARLRGNHDGKTNIFEYIDRFQKTNETHHLTKALFKFAEEAYGKFEREAMCTMFLEVSKHYEEGAKKYGADNWKKGMPVHIYIDSAVRHYLKWLRGDKDEPHDRAFVWNLMCCIWEVDYRDKKED